VCLMRTLFVLSWVSHLMPINEIYERGRRYEEDDDVWGRVWGRGMKYGVGRGFCGCWWLLVC